jgi:two-component system, NtrC family, sensor kinase
LPTMNLLISHSETGIERITTIIKSLRSYAESGIRDFQASNIKDLIDSSITLLHSKIPSYVNLEFNLTEVPAILCKQDRIIHVIFNIIDNAIDAILSKAEKSNEKICFETGIKELSQIKYLHLGISNTGPLIPDEMLKHVFDPFYSTKAPNKGSGLGLYISYSIIKEHNGILEVKNLNNTVVFNIYLPV